MRPQVRSRMMVGPNSEAHVLVRRPSADVLVVEIGGHWKTRAGLPGTEAVEKEMRAGAGLRRLEFETAGVGTWDTSLLAFLIKCLALAKERGWQIRQDGLPEGVRHLIRLSEAVPEREDAERGPGPSSRLNRLGTDLLKRIESVREGLTFLGENCLAFLNLLRGRAQFRWSDAFVVMQQTGPEALGIVALINFLVGLILAFVGAVQLTQFGAAVYVADLVAIGTVREMGCLMTGIIICGRTGAAFAAQLGAMKVNEEIDAFRTFGISPIEFLVLPRILALLLMMPLLCVFADLIGIVGGFVVSLSILDTTFTEYLDRTIAAITLQGFLLGIFKGACFGVLVALSGCSRGIQCGNNAAAVGQATTSSVVIGITSIVAADGVFAVLCNAFHI